ncbi:MAG: hypothetical protein JSW50_02940 [Candidatus Latescibacterota bacterium]|nr:MAG: hypothetical protein JSW50_02940 [Candidatus Latescibacterota bacterium]
MSSTNMTTGTSRVPAVFTAAFVVVLLSGNAGALGACGPATTTGAISCGDTLNLSGYAITTHIYEFEVTAGDKIAFIAWHQPGGTLEIAIKDADCTTTIMSDGDAYSTAKASICPFFARETSTYVLYVSAVGMRYVPFSATMICIDDAEYCATVPVEERTWGHIKTLYQ